MQATEATESKECGAIELRKRKLNNFECLLNVKSKCEMSLPFDIMIRMTNEQIALHKP